MPRPKGKHDNDVKPATAIAVLKALRLPFGHPTKTAVELARLADTSPSTVFRAVRWLRAQGHRIWSKRGWGYSLKFRGLPTPERPKAKRRRAA